MVRCGAWTIAFASSLLFKWHTFINKLEKSRKKHSAKLVWNIQNTNPLTGVNYAWTFAITKLKCMCPIQSGCECVRFWGDSAKATNHLQINTRNTEIHQFWIENGLLPKIALRILQSRRVVQLSQQNSPPLVAKKNVFVYMQFVSMEKAPVTDVALITCWKSFDLTNGILNPQFFN